MTTHLGKRLLTRRSFLTQSALAAGTALGTSSLLAACGSTSVTTTTQQPVVLKLFHWFSTEVGKKGQIKMDQLADLAVLSDDYFSVPGDSIQDITSVLHEERLFPPPAEFAGRAQVKGMDAYQRLAGRAQDDPEGFWADQAESLDCRKACHGRLSPS